ncbi:MAG: SDR family oxidoreductase [Pseudomonadota bacterium]|nr:SDR family oxidoreductase [Pseudomonadota bacterium]
MNILVTGGLGHIGSALIRKLPYLFNDLKETVIVDNLLNQRYPSLFNLPQSNFSFIEGDIRDLDFNSILKDIDYVIHLAAITDAAGSFGNSDQVELNNFECTKKIAEACLLKNIKLITLSSTSVYGTQKEVVTEDCSSEDLNPQSPYALTKLKEEKLMIKMNKKGLKVVCCRFGTIYGASIGMRFHTAVNKFCWQAAHKLPITVWSSAYDQKRPYLDLNDAINSFQHIIKKDIFDGNIYNVLTENLTVKHVVDEIQKHVPKLQIEFVDSEIMNQLSYDVSNEKFVKTGFDFKGNISKAIKDTLELFTYK